MEFKSHAALDAGTRLSKFNKIISTLKNHKEIQSCKILDIGTGAGVISSELGKTAKEVYSIDVVDERISKKNYKFLRINPDKKLPFKENFFDIIISNHVIEHVNNAGFHLDEINRILKKDGICYLATPNKFFIIEPHYKLPFLSIMPKNLANLYLIITKGGKIYDIKNLSYNNLKILFKKDFHFENILIKMLNDPEGYGLEDKFIKLINNFYILIKLFPFLMNIFTPTFIFILKKKFT